MKIKDGLSAVVLEVLDKDNYVAWSVQVKTYLMAHDLWEIIEGTTEPLRQEDDDVAFKARSKKNSMALHVIQISCGPNTFSEIIQITSAKIAWDTLAKKFLQVLEEDNFVNWSVRVKTYLMAYDLWDIIEATTEPPRQEDEVAIKAWSKKNSMALHVIQISCEPDTFSEIIQISSAKIAWDTLAKKFLQVLEEDNYVNWSVRVKTYLMAHDLWDIIERATEPPKQEDDEAAFKAWIKKNFMALHLLQVLCRPDALLLISRISLAKIAWDILAENYIAGNNKNRTDDFLEYKDLNKALQIGDWSAAVEFLKLKPHAVSAQITYLGETALHVAVEAGHEDIVEKLVDEMSEEDLAIQDCYGMTALVGAINAGNNTMAACMLRKNKNLFISTNPNEQIPLIQAISNGHIALAHYLYSVTQIEDLTPIRGPNGATLFTQAIYTRTLDIALDLIMRCPRLALTLDYQGLSPFYALATMSNAFPSGDRLVLWKRWIYSVIYIQPGSATEEIRLNVHNQNAENRRRDHEIIRIGSVKSFLRHQVSYLLDVLGIKHLYEMKLVHVQSRQLLSHMWKEISISNYEQRKKGCVYSAIVVAIKKGNIEFVLDAVKANPDLLWGTDERRSIFETAVQYRQPQIFRLICAIDKNIAFTYGVDKQGNNILHIAGILAASAILNRIHGAAWQMQNELQWFKEVERIVHPKFKEAFNNELLTPRELFTKEHKDLRKAGEEWMKSTSTSCTVVAALIVTIMFAVAFTVPGGNQDLGFPIFLHEKWFAAFIISDVMSLFLSTTSITMFFGIFVARYAEDDYLASLPNRMIIGLFTLLISIQAMLTAFSAAIVIMLREQPWTRSTLFFFSSLPITVLLCIYFTLLGDLIRRFKNSSIDRNF